MIGGDDIVDDLLAGKRKLTVSEPILEYPGWVQKHLTPKLEVAVATNPGNVLLWFHSQQGSPLFTGKGVYGILRNSDRLKECVSFGHLKWFVANPDKIPANFRGKKVFAWASVVQDDGNRLYVPCLATDQMTLYWICINSLWDIYCTAALKASSF